MSGPLKISASDAAAALDGTEKIPALQTTSSVHITPAQIQTYIGSNFQAQGDVLDDLNTLGAAASDGEFIVATAAGVFAYESGNTARTSLGLGTGNSPQFTGIELGHASDTTITRASSGQIAVEGTNVAMSGGAFHDGFSDFVANEHVDHTAVTLTAGAGLTGGGDIASNRSFAVGEGTGITVNADDVQIADGGVDTTQLADEAVTYAKMQHVSATNRVLGRDTAGAGDVEEIAEAGFKAMFNLEIGTDVLAQQTIGISDDNLLEVDGSPNSGEYARFTANGLEGRTEAEFKADFNLEIGTDVQAYDDDLAAVAALTTTAAGLTTLEISDPGADRVLAWDDTAGVVVPIALADITDEASPANGDFLLVYGAEGDLRRVDWEDLPGAGGGLDNIVEDATPQLGGALDGQGNDLNNMGVLFLTEQAAAEADVAGKGQFWVETATPNVAKFTDDAGSDFSLANFETLASTSNGEGAALVGIEDSGAIYTATTVEAALAEVKAIADTALQEGKHTIWIPASAMIAAETSGPASTTVEASTNDQNYPVLDYDASADEYAHFQIALPKSYNLGTVTYQVWWTTAHTGTDGVTWALQALGVANGDPIDASWGTAVTVDDAGLSAAGDVLVSAESTAVTIADTPADDDLMFFRLFRDVSDANDDMTEDARLIGVKIFITLDAPTDT